MPDVTLTITIPEANVADVIEAFSGLSGEWMQLSVIGEEPVDVNFIIDPQDGGGETLKAFGQRFVRTLGVQAVRIHKKRQDRQRYATEVAAIVPPVDEVDNNIIT